MNKSYALLLACLFAGCQTDEAWEIPTASTVVFDDDVYPVLLRDCAFHTCHGSSERFLQIWGPGRVRLIPNTNAFDVGTDAERQASRQRAESFIDQKDPRRSLILRKALAVEAGGSGHLGADQYGRNVYRSTESPGYLALSRWVFSVTSK
jgi:hypothetical protein